LKSVNVFKTVNYVNYEFSGERWIAGSDIRVSGFPSVTWHINTPSLQSDLEIMRPRMRQLCGTQV
jgi:hypothetical protein